jgi:hypothetical protein
MAIEQYSQADLFVHPDYHRLGGYPLNEAVESYEAALHERIDSAQLPILIYRATAAERGTFWHRFPSDQRFRSLPDSGLLDGDQVVQDFNQLLNGQAVCRGIVHGSYLGQCIRDFRGSLMASATTGILYYTQIHRKTGYAAHVHSSEAVKYGIVLVNNRMRRGVAPEHDIADLDLAPDYHTDDSRVFYAR